MVIHEVQDLAVGWDRQKAVSTFGVDLVLRTPTQYDPPFLGLAKGLTYMIALKNSTSAGESIRHEVARVGDRVL